MDTVNKYLENITSMLAAIADSEKKNIGDAARLAAEAYENGKKIYIFGCTHSAIMAEDVFYRAGAPAFWRPLWGPGMSISSTPGFLTSAAEHNEELGNAVIECSRLGKDDLLVILSTSGKNAAPVAVADSALKRGAKLVIISSKAYIREKGNHSKIKNLWAFGGKSVMIDNHVPLGDASLDVGGGCMMGPVSTIAGSFIVHSVSALSVEYLAMRSIPAPVFKSSNAPGGLEHNRKLLEMPGVLEAFTLP